MTKTPFTHAQLKDAIDRLLPEKAVRFEVFAEQVMRDCRVSGPPVVTKECVKIIHGMLYQMEMTSSIQYQDGWLCDRRGALDTGSAYDKLPPERRLIDDPRVSSWFDKPRTLRKKHPRKLMIRNKS